MTTWDPSRRDVLVGGAGGLVAALAGCSTRTGGQEAPAGGSTEGDPPSDGGAGNGTSTTTPEAATGSTDGLVLPSLDVAGSPGSLVALEPAGKAVLLDFFATWCPPCEPQMEHLRAVREKYDRAAVSIVSITQETDEEAIESFWTEHRGTWPVVMDPSTRAAREYDATTIPTIVVLAPDGTEVARHTGLVDEQPLDEAITAALETNEGNDGNDGNDGS